MGLTDSVLPRGQYGWLWTAERTADGTPAGIVALAKRAGLRGILAKYHEGSARKAARGPGDWARNFRALVQPCAEAGLLLIPWAYTHPDDYRPDVIEVIAEAVATSAPANPQRFYIFDPEIEFDRDAEAAAKTRMLFATLSDRGVRGRWLYSSWGWVDQHPSFPWAAWQENCEAFLPQAYPRTMQVPNPDLVWNRAYGGAQFGGPQARGWTGPQGFRALKPERPIIPAFDIYDNVIPRLAHLAANWGAPAVSWWVMDSAGEQTIAQLAATSYASSKAEPAPPVIDNPPTPSETEQLRADLARERARADDLQRRLDRITRIARGEEG